MECQICSRHYSEVSGLHCPGCARATLFPLRLQHAQVLIEREDVERQANAAATHYVTTTEHHAFQSDIQDKYQAGEAALAHDRILGESAASQMKIETVTRHAEMLKNNMRELRERLDEGKAAAKQRRRALTDSKKDTAVRGEQGADSVRRDISEHTRSYERQYQDIVVRRLKRCKAAVNLAGLKQIIKPADGSKKVPQYCIWNMLIPDIRHLNAAEHTHVSTVLYHVSRLLCQVSGYLHSRLPAEIVLPHNDWPAPTVFSPASSYSGRDVSFPKLSPGSSRDVSSKGSREFDQRTAGRPRLLFLDRKLPKLARENPSAYALLVEGIALLAWDIAWLCRTQGLPVAEKEWDDICDMGRNLWLLFANAHDTADPSRKRAPARDPITNIKQAEGVRAFSPTPVLPALGVHSHGSARHFLESAAPAADGICDVSVKGWAFAFPVKIMDELKAALLNDMSGHDWELLDDRDDELADGTDAEENVVVDQTGQTARDGKAVPERIDDRKGKNGWTKLKSRSQS
ncbi:MAG: hypothetical protein Q9162_004076 [Coniocarpon cinnabarinum]